MLPCGSCDAEITGIHIVDFKFPGLGKVLACLTAGEQSSLYANNSFIKEYFQLPKMSVIHVLIVELF